MNETIKIARLSDFKVLEKQLTERWIELERNSNAFRYKLKVQKQAILDGKLHFLVQVKLSSIFHNIFILVHFLNHFSMKSLSAQRRTFDDATETTGLFVDCSTVWRKSVQLQESEWMRSYSSISKPIEYSKWCWGQCDYNVLSE